MYYTKKQIELVEDSIKIDITTNGKAVEENMQGGKEMDLKELQSKYDKLNESYKTKEERIRICRSLSIS